MDLGNRIARDEKVYKDIDRRVNASISVSGGINAVVANKKVVDRCKASNHN